MDNETIYIIVPQHDDGENIIAPTTIETDSAYYDSDLDDVLAEYSEDIALSDCTMYGEEGSILQTYFVNNGDIDPEYWDALALNMDNDIVRAALDCGIDISDIEESYQGRYNSDVDFAQETADLIGYDFNHEHWPHRCIDWEQAAYELMFDHCESNGHYFRS